MRLPEARIRENPYRVLRNAGEVGSAKVSKVVVTGDRFPLVGRGDELERLADALASARSGHPRVVLVQGAPGIGKAALVRHFVTGQVATQTLWAAGEPGERATAFD